MAESSGNAGTSNGSQTPKVIPSLAKKQSDVTRLGTQKLKFVPTLPARRKKEDAKPEQSSVSAPSTPARGSGRGRGSDRGSRGRGGGGGAGRGVPPPVVEMTASGPFAMGPTLAGKTGFSSSSGPRSNFTPVMPGGPGAVAKLGAGLTQSAAPTLGGGGVKKEGEENMLRRREGGESKEMQEEEEQVYSDQEDGVEIVDIEKVRLMDWMAPESLKRERDAKDRRKVKKEEKKDVKGKGAASSSNDMQVDDEVISDTEENEKVNMANAVDLSESEDEEELEDIVDDFAPSDRIQDDAFDHHDRLFFFQFPEPFPTFVSKSSMDSTSSNPTLNDKGKGVDRERKVSFAEDTKPPGPSGPATNGAVITAESKDREEDKKVDGVVGQLEIYQSGAVKMRMGDGIVYDVTAATQPSFLQHAVYLDADKKQLCVLGEINRRFVVSPDLEVLLSRLEVGEQPVDIPELEAAGLIAMDTS